MISIQNSKRFCKGDYREIENYDLAIADTENTWELHHRDEVQPDGVVLSRKWMQEHGIYNSVPPYSLIYLHPIEHRKLHLTDDMNPCWKGDSAKATAKYHRAKKLFRANKISEDEYNAAKAELQRARKEERARKCLR